MTATGAARPKILFAVGAPDGVSGAEAEQQFADGRLQGVSGLTKPLLTWLSEREHPLALVMFGSDMPLSDAAARRYHAHVGGDVLVNLVCEPELHGQALRQLASFERATQLPVVNPAAAVIATTRPQIARRLAGQRAVRAPHCTRYEPGGRTLVEHIEHHGHRYPVLLRPPGRHGSEGLVRADRPDEIAVAAAMPQACTVTDFVDFRSSDGLWRKRRMVHAGGRLFRRHVLTGRDWNITRAARDFMAEHPQLVAEEQDWLARPVTLEPGSVDARVHELFGLLGLDFGVIDFALTPAGDVVVFEINACVQLTNRSEALDRRYFEANTDDILATLVAAICARAAAR